METDPYYRDGRKTALWWTLNLARGVILVPFWTARAVVGAIAFVVPAVRNTYAHVFSSGSHACRPRNRGRSSTAPAPSSGQVAVQAMIAALAVRWPSAILFGYVVPVTVAGVLSARRVLIEHNYERVADRRLETIVATTNDNYLGLLGRLALAPRNIGFHIVHHIHPQVSLEALPRLKSGMRGSIRRCIRKRGDEERRRGAVNPRAPPDFQSVFPPPPLRRGPRDPRSSAARGVHR